jgi:hypothetical protein
VIVAVVVIAYVVDMGGLMPASELLIVVAVIVYPFKWLRRSYRVLKATSREYDHDGYRKVPDRCGYHYEGGGWGMPIYPLDWPQRNDAFHSEPQWCVTTSHVQDRFWFCKRDGSRSRRLPKRLRGLDPGQAYRELETRLSMGGMSTPPTRWSLTAACGYRGRGIS